MKLPTIAELTELVKHIKTHIAEDYRAFEDDELPGIQLTVACNDNGEWDYQTGDNSYSGSAYHYPHWAVVGVYRRSNSRDLAKDLEGQLAELVNN